ncbi:MAG: FAD-dependent monooxygenase [Proteobacteria bacterium]|nr:FAD-dependent monooxygenase [Pseudomonadota bacterium]
MEKDNLSQIRVIGAGPAGLIFALLTAKKTFQIMLHEKDSEGFFAQQSRALALSPSSIEILSEIGISPDQDSSFIPIKTIHTSQKNSFGRVLIEDDGKELGYVIRYKNLIKLLLDRVKTNKYIKIIFESEILSINDQQDFFTDDKSKIYKYDFLLFSDGIGKLLSNTFEFDTDPDMDGLLALVAEIRTELNHQYCAYERFTVKGPVALLPLENQNLSKLVWTGKKDFIMQMLNCDKQSFSTLFADHFGERLGKLTHIDEKYAYPLSHQFIRQPYQKNILVSGNAAHAMHPVAGQGLNLTIRDLKVLLSLLDKNDYQISETLLKQYSDERKREVRSMMKISSHLVKGFSNQMVGANLLRGSGMFLLDNSFFVKKMFKEKFSYGKN